MKNYNFVEKIGENFKLRINKASCCLRKCLGLYVDKSKKMCTVADSSSYPSIFNGDAPETHTIRHTIVYRSLEKQRYISRSRGMFDILAFAGTIVGAACGILSDNPTLQEIIKMENIRDSVNALMNYDMNNLIINHRALTIVSVLSIVFYIHSRRNERRYRHASEEITKMDSIADMQEQIAYLAQKEQPINQEKLVEIPEDDKIFFEKELQNEGNNQKTLSF